MRYVQLAALRDTVYDQTQMRRGFSIFLILFFGLGPLSSMIDGSEDAGLPACCRRHGAHHCAVAVQMAAMKAQIGPGSTRYFAAPITCPYFPGASAMLATPARALTAKSAIALVEIERARAFVSSHVALPSAPSRAHAGRGPPSSDPS